MPQPVPQAVQPAPVGQGSDLVVGVEVGDVADLRDRQPSFAALQRATTDLQVTETGGEIAQLAVRQALVGKHQHGVAVDRVPDVANRGRFHRLAEVEASDRRGEVRTEGLGVDGHAGSSVCFPGPLAPSGGKVQTVGAMCRVPLILPVRQRTVRSAGGAARR